MMAAGSHGYDIDYDDLDVVDLVRQIRERASRSDTAGAVRPEAIEERVRGRLRAYVDLDERRPYELEESLGLVGDWNVRPEDLRTSGERGFGVVAGALRRLARPFLKLLANLELPLYKQFKVNLGLAEAVHDLLRENAELRGRVEELSRRIDRLESGASDGARPADSATKTGASASRSSAPGSSAPGSSASGASASSSAAPGASDPAPPDPNLPG